MLVGDVHPEVADVAGAMTPVPGGVGPLTVTMLMMNTLRAARARPGSPEASRPPADDVVAGRVRRRPDRRHATGKSHVRERFERLGVPTIDSDRLARDAVAPGSRSCGRRRAVWTERARFTTGALDRYKLAEIVFADEQARKTLESIIHPEVRRATDAWFTSLDPARHPYAIADIPLLFEVNRDRDFDVVSMASAKRQIRRSRRRTRYPVRPSCSVGWGDGLSEAECARAPVRLVGYLGFANGQSTGKPSPACRLCHPLLKTEACRDAATGLHTDREIRRGRESFALSAG